jgi:hypothetical protein
MSNDMTGFTPSQFRDFLLGWFKSGNYTDVVYAEGHHGIGKTDIVLQVAIDFFGTEEQKKMSPAQVLAMSEEERGWVFHREYPATKNVEDYTGIPFRDPVSNKTVWATPDFFPTKGKGVMVIGTQPSDGGSAQGYVPDVTGQTHRLSHPVARGLPGDNR